MAHMVHSVDQGIGNIGRDHCLGFGHLLGRLWLVAPAESGIV